MKQADRGPLNRLTKERKAELFIVTVAERAQLFTKAERDRAMAAYQFVRNTECRVLNKILASKKG